MVDELFNKHSIQCDLVCLITAIPFWVVVSFTQIGDSLSTIQF